MIEIKAYAKVNLTLDVLGKRRDGYHELDSIMQNIDLFDTIALEKSAEMKITVNGDFDAPADERNLVWRACELVRERFNLPGSFSATVTKRIPSQAGLGGGSSDGAAALVAAVKLYGVEASKPELEEMAAALGSDVPFFITGGTARMKGRGEIIEPLPDAPELPIVVVWPGFGVSTPKAYAALDSDEAESAYATEKAVCAVVSGDKPGLISSLSNDFEPVVTRDYPEIAEVKSKLKGLGAEATLLSGSGSAVFGVFPDNGSAKSAVKTLSEVFAFVSAARTVPCSSGV